MVEGGAKVDGGFYTPAIVRLGTREKVCHNSANLSLQMRDTWLYRRMREAWPWAAIEGETRLNPSKLKLRMTPE